MIGYLDDESEGEVDKPIPYLVGRDLQKKDHRKTVDES